MTELQTEAVDSPNARQTVLVVDDNEANRYAVSYWLREAGYVVTEAGTGEEALKRAEDGPDIIVLDIRLPDTSGFEVARTLKAAASTALIPILHLSASFTSSEWRTHGLEIGADGYLTHPVDPRELVATVRSLLRVRAAEAEQARLLEAERSAREQAERARAAAERADAAKSEFLATMSHELRTPLNAIQGYVQLLDMGLAGPVTSTQREYLARLTSSSQHLLGLVNDVLDLARVDAGHVMVARENGMTGAAISAAMALLAPQADARGVRVVRAGDDEGGVPYVGDEHRVRQVLVNLLTNAVKFTPAGGLVTLYSDVAALTPPGGRLAGDGPWAFVRVSDTGIGIPRERQGSMFEPFVQADAGLTRVVQGSGLGLSISRRLARLMGGDVTVESALGEGAAFTLWLPSTAAALQNSAPDGGPAPGAPPEGDTFGSAVASAGLYLRQHQDELIDRFVERLSQDRSLPADAARQRRQVEDHVITLVANLSQSLVLVEEAGEFYSDLLRDGGEIQRVIADLHGRQRRRLGWTEEQVAREYAILDEEVAALVQRARPTLGEVEGARDVLHRLISRAAESSARAYRHSAGL